MDATIDGSHMESQDQVPDEHSNNKENRTVQRDALKDLDVVETRELPRESPLHPLALSKLNAAKACLRAHKPLVGGLCALLAVATTIGVAQSIQASSVPSNDLVAADARTRVTEPDYDVGNYGDKTTLRVTSVEVRSVKATSSEEATASQPGASKYAEAAVAVTFENDSVKAVETATLGFAKIADTWTAAGSAKDQRTTYEAKQGIDEQELLKNISAALDTAEALEGGSYATSGSPSLAAIYADGSVSIEENNFDADAQTDDIELQCARSDVWSSYEANIGLHFEFRSVTGRWEITSSDVPKDAQTRSYSPIQGSYQGIFQTQSTDGKKCLAAASSPLLLKIDSTDGDQISGTVSLLVHLHTNPQEDSDACEGDKNLQEIQFKAKLEDGGDESKPRFKATLPDQTDGTVELELIFGTESDSNAVQAIVKTSYRRTTSLLFIPYEQTATYVDTYTLQ